MELSDKPSGPYQLFTSLHGATIGQTGMKHGDMLFLKFEEIPHPILSTSNQAQPIESSANKLSGTQVDLPETSRRDQRAHGTEMWKSVSQLPVDDFLEKQSGKIPRQRDKMCKHALKGMCDYCMPLERNHIGQEPICQRLI